MTSSENSQPQVNPRLFALTKRFFNFVNPTANFNLKEQITLYHTLTKTYPIYLFSGFAIGELFAFSVLRKFPRKLDIHARPHRIYLTYIACGLFGAFTTLPGLGYLMTFDLMKLDPSESPQSTILHAQLEENMRRRQYKKEGKQKERQEFDWEDSEKSYVDIAEQIRQENKLRELEENTKQDRI